MLEKKNILDTGAAADKSVQIRPKSEHFDTGSVEK